MRCYQTSKKIWLVGFTSQKTEERFCGINRVFGRIWIELKIRATEEVVQREKEGEGSSGLNPAEEQQLKISEGKKDPNRSWSRI